MIGFLVHDDRFFPANSAVVACRSLRTYRYQSTEQLGFLRIHFFRNASKNNYFLRDERYTVCVAGTLIFKNVYGLDAVHHLREELRAGNAMEDLFASLRGPYTLLLIDRKLGELIILNSREGLRNCYVAVRNGLCAYSTNLLMLAALSGAGPSAEGVRQFIHVGGVLDQKTIFEDVEVVSAASLNVYRDSIWTTRRLWRLQPSVPDQSITREDATSKVAEMFISNLGFTSQLQPGRAATDLTGGTDSRTLLCCLMENHAKPIASTAGPSGFVDVEIARRVAANLGVEHYWYRPTWEDVTPESIDRAVELADGTRNVIGLAKILPYYAEKAQRFDFITGGGGGPLFKDHYWLFEFNRVGLGREPDWKRIAKLSIVKYAIRDDFFSGFADRIMENLTTKLQQRSALVKGTNNQKLDFVYFDLKVPAFGGQDFSLTTQFVDTLHPMLDGTNVQYSINLPPSIRIRDILLFGIIQSLRPKIRWMQTDSGLPTIPQVGLYSWLRVLRLRRYTQAAIRKTRTALFGSSGEGTDQSQGINRLQSLGYFDLLNPASMTVRPFVSSPVLAEFTNSPCRQPNQSYVIATISAELFFQRVKYLSAETNRPATTELIPTEWGFPDRYSRPLD